jgi:hypothetical protein
MNRPRLAGPEEVVDIVAARIPEVSSPDRPGPRGRSVTLHAPYVIHIVVIHIGIIHIVIVNTKYNTARLSK